MNWLFWKEYRQNRVIVIALIVMMVGPHLFGLFAMAYDWYQGGWHRFRLFGRQDLLVASLYSLAISQVALALIGGNAIAGERADRSAEFQVYLPLTREKILAAKLLLVLAIAVAIWLVNPLIIVWSTLSSSGNPPPIPVDMFYNVMLNTAITGFVFFCVAWFFSTILRSPTFSVIAGLVTPLIIISLIGFGAYLAQRTEWERTMDSMAQILYVSVSLAVALPSFGLGTWLYLRRVEP